MEACRKDQSPPSAVAAEYLNPFQVDAGAPIRRRRVCALRATRTQHPAAHLPDCRVPGPGPRGVTRAFLRRCAALRPRPAPRHRPTPGEHDPADRLAARGTASPRCCPVVALASLLVFRLAIAGHRGDVERPPRVLPAQRPGHLVTVHAWQTDIEKRSTAARVASVSLWSSTTSMRSGIVSRLVFRARAFRSAPGLRALRRPARSRLPWPSAAPHPWSGR